MSSAARDGAGTIPGARFVGSDAPNLQHEAAESAALGLGIEPRSQRGQVLAGRECGMAQPATRAVIGAACAEAVRASTSMAAILRIIDRSMVDSSASSPETPATPECSRMGLPARVYGSIPGLCHVSSGRGPETVRSSQSRKGHEDRPGGIQ